MSVAAQITAIDLSATDKEQRWKEHAKHQRESGLSRAAYCREHQLNYEQFGYWLQKWRQQTICSRLNYSNTQIPHNEIFNDILNFSCKICGQFNGINSH